MEFWIAKCDEMKKISIFLLIKKVNLMRFEGVWSKMTRILNFLGLRKADFCTELTLLSIKLRGIMMSY